MKQHDITEMLPGLLVGLTVKRRYTRRIDGLIIPDQDTGVILKVGHHYGPGTAYCQAFVRWTCNARPGQCYGSGQPNPLGQSWTADAWDYLDTLQIA